MKLRTHAVEKPWGRTDLTPAFGGISDDRIGEVWFEHSDQDRLPLLVKYIFTSEKLSVQVHPNDTQAAERGLRSGKSECWYILEADEGATLGLGLKTEISQEALRRAAMDGTIEDLIDWRPVAPGDFFYVPAGTVHAIGAGIMLLEIQQNSDVTYRLYDYGRPRELHLDDGVSVSSLGEYENFNARVAGGPNDAVLLDGPHFTVLRTTAAFPSALTSRRKWIIPLRGSVESGEERVTVGECLFLQPGDQFELHEGGMALVAVEGSLAA